MIPLNIIVADKDMLAQYMAYLQKYNPEFNIHFFNDLDCRKLIADYFPSLVWHTDIKREHD